jgi:hypothetical protein
MKRWLAASELAGLPGMPSTDRGVAKMAERADWISRARVGRGGGMEYCVESLPGEARSALLDASQLAVSQGSTAPQLARGQQLIGEQSMAKLATLDGWKKQKTGALLELWLALERYKLANDCTWLQAVLAWNGGAIADAPQARAAKPMLSWPTFERMRAKVNQKGLAGLVPKYGNRKGDTLIEKTPVFRSFLIGMRVEYPHARAKLLRDALKAKFGDEHSLLPTVHQVKEFVKRFEAEHGSELLAVTNPDDWKNRRMAAPGNASEDVARLNQRWEIDSTPADVMCIDGRCSIIVCVDIYSRRVKLLVSRTSKGDAIALLLRRCLLDWGVPEEIVTDRGSDYLSNYVLGIFKSLSIRHVPRGPFMPWKKPHIERVIGTFSRSAVVELNPDFIGHSVEQRSAIESRQSFAERLFKKNAVVPVELTEPALQKLCDGWSDTIYVMDEHSSLGCSPFERAAAWTGAVRRIENARALDLLLLPVPDNDGWRTVQKKGIKVDAEWYYMPAFDGIVGERVRAHYDPADMGLLFVYQPNASGDLHYLGQAGNPAFAGISYAEFLEKLAEARADAHDDLARKRRELKRLGRGTEKREIVGKILDDARARTNRIAQLPRPAAAEIHTTPALQAAAAAAADPAAQQPARATVLQGPMPAGKSRAELVAEKYDRALALERRIAAGELVDVADREWLQRWSVSSDYRVEKQMRQMQETFKTA